MKCKCKRFLWFKIECDYCKKRRIKNNKRWELNHTFVYGEKVLVDDDFIGKNIGATVVDKEFIYHFGEPPSTGYTEINYYLKLFDGNIKKFSRYSIKKVYNKIRKSLYKELGELSKKYKGDKNV